MYPIFGLTIEWWLLIVLAVVGMIVQGRLQAVFGKYSRVMYPGGLTGRDIAEKMLRDNGIHDVKVVPTRGNLTDNYNPKTKTINLSESVYGSNSVAAAAVAAHETGHAIQDATEYAPLRMRSALVPVVSFTSQFAIWVVIIGILIINLSNSYTVYWIGILMVAVAALFAIITLPVEYNASSRAMAWLRTGGGLDDAQAAQAKTALSWAARTYLVAAISAIITLLYYISAARRN